MITEQFLAEQEQLDNLNTCLVAFIKEGLSDGMRKRRSAIKALSLLQGHVSVESVARYSNPFNFDPSNSVGKKNKKPDIYDEAVIEVCYGRFFEFMQKSHIRSMLNNPPPPHVGRMSVANYDRLLTKYGYDNVDELTSDADDYVVKAWRTARVSYIRAQQRVAAMMFLRSQIGSHLTGADREDLDCEVETLMDQLFGAVGSCFDAEMKFAILLGGEYLNKTRSKILDVSLAKDVGIMQYLNVDLKYPGSYMAQTCDDFRSKISEYAAQ